MSDIKSGGIGIISERLARGMDRSLWTLALTSSKYIIPMQPETI